MPHSNPGNVTPLTPMPVTPSRHHSLIELVDLAASLVYGCQAATRYTGFADGRMALDCRGCRACPGFVAGLRHELSSATVQHRTDAGVDGDTTTTLVLGRFGTYAVRAETCDAHNGAGVLLVGFEIADCTTDAGRVIEHGWRLDAFDALATTRFREVMARARTLRNLEPREARVRIWWRLAEVLAEW